MNLHQQNHKPEQLVINFITGESEPETATVHRIRILVDQDPQNPRTDWDYYGTMVCFHGRYLLGDEDHGYSAHDFDSWDEVYERIVADHDPWAILPLYLYDHSGITMSTGAFHCPWDSGQVGFIFVSAAQVKEYFMGSWHRRSAKRVAQLEASLRSVVEVYDHYLTGMVYGFIVEEAEVQRIDGVVQEPDEDDWEEIDACWGFYGDDIDGVHDYAGWYVTREQIEDAFHNIEY